GPEPGLVGSRCACFACPAERPGIGLARDCWQTRAPKPAGSVIMLAGGPLRIVAWFTWSGRERSSQSRSPQVPQIRLASFLSSFSLLVLNAKLTAALHCRVQPSRVVA